jgi:lysophospholipase L1-like esterase
MPSERFSSPWFKVALIAGSLLAGLVFCEVGVRVLAALSAESLSVAAATSRAPNGSDFVFHDVIAPSENPGLIYELLPNREGRLLGAPYRSNALGMRRDEAPSASSPGVWRIAALGDSTMFGWAIEEKAAYPAVLERHLNAVGDGVRYEVLNLAVPGYNTAQEVESLAGRINELEPDLVMIQFDFNDLALPNFLQDRPSVLTLRRSFLVSMVREALMGRNVLHGLSSLAAPRLVDAPMREVRSKAYGILRQFEYQAENTPPRYRYMVGWEGVTRALDRLWATTDRPVLHLSSPTFTFEEQNMFETGAVDGFAEHVKTAHETREDGERLHYLDLVEETRAFTRERGIDFLEDMSIDYPRDQHPSPDRHALIARAIYLALVENHLLPPESKHYDKKNAVARGMLDEVEALWRARRGEIPEP